MPDKAPKTNLRVLTPSKKRIREGDLFAMQLPSGNYLFGRVVSLEMVIGPMKGVVLVYVYRYQSPNKAIPDRTQLTPRNLLIAPVGTNSLAWSQGYFETIANLPLEDGDVLEQHCFRDSDRNKFFDERGREIPARIEQCSEYGLHSYRTIDDEISKALGLELAPD